MTVFLTILLEIVPVTRANGTINNVTVKYMSGCFSWNVKIICNSVICNYVFIRYTEIIYQCYNFHKNILVYENMTAANSNYISVILSLI